MYLAEAITSVVSPIAAEQLVALYSDSGQISIRCVIEQSVTELGQTCTGAAGDDLLKRIKWVKGAPGLPTSVGVGVFGGATSDAIYDRQSAYAAEWLRRSDLPSETIQWRAPPVRYAFGHSDT